MDRQGIIWHVAILGSPLWLWPFVYVVPIGPWPGACMLALGMPVSGTMAATMGVAHLLLRPRSIVWGIGMLTAAAALYFLGYAASIVSELDGSGPCIPRGWESWPWLY